jgi:hypothetical protein
VGSIITVTGYFASVLLCAVLLYVDHPIRYCNDFYYPKVGMVSTVISCDRERRMLVTHSCRFMVIVNAIPITSDPYLPS